MVQFNDTISYEIFEDGYDIYDNGKPWIKQREPYAHIYLPNGTYEENAIAQCEDITKEPEHEPTEEEKLRANQDFIALMLDMDLPN